MLSEVLHAIAVNMIAVGICCIYISLVFKISQKTFNAAFEYQKAWEKNVDIRPLAGLYGKFVMWHVKKNLKKLYSEFPKVGDLLRANATGKMFIVIHSHVPDPISPHGYIDLQRMDEGHHDFVRIALQDYFPLSYEKVDKVQEAE